MCLQYVENMLNCGSVVIVLIKENIMSKSLIEQLDNLKNELYNSIDIPNSKSSSESVKKFKEVQVHVGCGGCNGTMMSCAIDR